MSELVENENQATGYTVTLGSETLEQHDAKGLESIMIQDHEEKIGVCFLSIGHGELDFESFKEGDDVKVEVDGSDDPLFQGVITGIRHTWKGGKEYCNIQAMDPLIKLAATTDTKSYNDESQTQSDDQIVKEVLSDASVDAGTIDTSTVKRETTRMNESALTFIKRLAARNGYIVDSSGGKINFRKPQSSDPAVEIPPEQLMSFDSTKDASMIPKTVKVIGFDYMENKVVQGEFSSSDVTKVGGGDAPSSTIFGGTHYVTGVRVTTDDAAKAMAQSIMEKAAKGMMKGKAAIQGNGTVSSNTKLKFTGMNEGFNAEVTVVSTTHTIDDGGFKTTIQFRGNTAPK
jgi:hypothetical protein